MRLETPTDSENGGSVSNREGGLTNAFLEYSICNEGERLDLHRNTEVQFLKIDVKCLDLA